MAIIFSIETKGTRSGNRAGNHSLTAGNIRHVKLPAGCGIVGFNIDAPAGNSTRGVWRMEIDEARMLAAMLIEGAEMAERRDGVVREDATS